ncbi:MAG TPA: cytochrome c [Thermoanaerobaculia bacterium]|nr:cytochrome c [Thermoanaerobaculia bacterium]
MSRGSAFTECTPAARLRRIAPLALGVVLALAACRPPQKMADQPSYRPLEPSLLFADGMSARQPVPGTVPRGGLRDESLLHTGRIGGVPVDAYPFEIGREDLERGRERYEIFCSPCHGMVGAGDGMIVERGFRRPPSFHSELLRERTAGHFYDVIANGFGVMPPYAAQIPVRDRWLIVAWIRVLQLSQDAPLAEVPEAERAQLFTGGSE